MFPLDIRGVPLSTSLSLSRSLSPLDTTDELLCRAGAPGRDFDMGEWFGGVLVRLCCPRLWSGLLIMGVRSDAAELGPVCPSSFSSDSLIAAATARSASGAILVSDESASARSARACEADSDADNGATCASAAADDGQEELFLRDSDASPSSDGAPSPWHCSNDDRAELS